MAGILLAGCGGSDDGDAGERAPRVEQRTLEQTAQAPAPPREPVQPAAPEPEPEGADAPRPDEAGDASVSAPRRDRLEHAGYDVIQSRVGGLDPAPRAALELPLKGGAQLTVFVYGSPRDARAKAREFRPLARQAPTHVALAVEGATVYFALAEDAGATLDRAEFDDVVRISEGA